MYNNQKHIVIVRGSFFFLLIIIYFPLTKKKKNNTTKMVKIIAYSVCIQLYRTWRTCVRKYIYDACILKTTIIEYSSLNVYWFSKSSNVRYNIHIITVHVITWINKYINGKLIIRFGKIKINEFSTEHHFCARGNWRKTKKHN